VLSTVVGNTLGNLLLLVVLPMGAYLAWHRFRHGRELGEILDRAGLRLGETRFLVPAGGMSLLVLVAAVVWHPSPEVMGREGMASSLFVGAGLGGRTWLAALLYGVVQTGFCEELFFRGMVTGSLARRMPDRAANLVQAGIFLLPHLLVLQVAPTLWPLLGVIFVVSLVKGWLRMESGSMVGPWMIHATGNVTTALVVASQSV